MKPLTLTISGLHSFRNERTIDFQTLGLENLFGVFGPTGSGKTSILDAITLALFGEVNRASNHSDFISSGLDRCYVSFTFEIKKQSNPQRYTVERQYFLDKRSEAKLYIAEDQSEGETRRVLADKTTEVSESIVSILGIGKKDFSKAVIIPQGEFAAFLQLKPKARGEFLKGLFDLRELGTRIDNRISSLYGSRKREQEQLDWKLAELEKFNDEELAARTAAFERAEKEATLRTAEHESAEKAYSEAAQLLEHVTRLTELTKGSEEREQYRKQIEALELSLKRASDAAEVEGSVTRYREATARERDAAKALEEARIAQQSAEELITPLVPQQKKMEDRRGENGIITRLGGEIETLKSLVDVDRGIDELVREIAAKSEEIGTTKSTIATTAERITQLKEQRKKLDAEKDELEKSDQTGKKSLKNLERKRETIKDLLNASERLEETTRRVTSKSKEARESEERVATLTKQSESLAKEADIIRTNLEEGRAELDRLRRDNRLASLLPDLVDGDPCPLCGSEEHPHPHEASNTEETGELEEKIATLQKRLESATTTASTARESMKQAEAQRDERRKNRDDLVTDQKVAEERLKALLTGGTYDGATDPETLRGFLVTCETRISALEESQSLSAARLEELTKVQEQLAGTITSAEQSEALLKQSLATTTSDIEKGTARLKERRAERETRLSERGLSATVAPEGRAAELVKAKSEELEALEREAARIEKEYVEAKEKKQEAATRYDAAFKAQIKEEQSRTEALRDLEKRLADHDFDSVEEWSNATLPREERDRLGAEVKSGQTRIADEEAELIRLKDLLGESTVTAVEVEGFREKHQKAEEAYRAALEQRGDAGRALKDCRAANEELKKLQSESAESAKEYEVVKTLRGYLSGNAFIDFIANDRLRHICRTASKELGRLTGGRLHIDAESGSGFYIIDHASGGVERPTASLSGGETFLVSLALALALSESLQTRGAPLEFFFLDEGFGTLDADLLETVMDALDRIRTESNRTIGIISHVRELHERIPRRLIVSPATETEGTDVLVEVG